MIFLILFKLPQNPPRPPLFPPIQIPLSHRFYPNFRRLAKEFFRSSTNGKPGFQKQLATNRGRKKSSDSIANWPDYSSPRYFSLGSVCESVDWLRVVYEFVESSGSLFHPLGESRKVVKVLVMFSQFLVIQFPPSGFKQFFDLVVVKSFADQFCR